MFAQGLDLLAGVDIEQRVRHNLIGIAIGQESLGLAVESRKNLEASSRSHFRQFNIELSLYGGKSHPIGDCVELTFALDEINTGVNGYQDLFRSLEPSADVNIQSASAAVELAHVDVLVQLGAGVEE